MKHLIILLLHLLSLEIIIAQNDGPSFPKLIYSNLKSPDNQSEKLPQLINEIDFQRTISPQIRNKNNQALLNSIILQTINNSTKTEYIYNDHGTVIAEINSSLLNGNWENKTKNIFEVNKFGLITKLTSFVYNKNQWIQSSITNKNYNNNLKLIEDVTLKVIDGNQLINENKIKYGYNQDGKQNLVESYIWNNGEWQKEYARKYSYNNEGKLLEFIFRDYIRECGFDFDSRRVYKYDSNQNKVYELSQISLGGEWENTRELHYQYDKNNRILFTHIKNWDSDGIDETRISYFYKTNRTEKLIEKYTNNDWQFFERYVSEFNSKGYIQSIIKSIWRGNNWEVEYSKIWNYNSSDQMIEYSYEKWDENKNYSFEKIRDQYNSEGKIIERIITSNNSEKRKLTWKYDLNGNNIQSEAFVFKNNSWQISDQDQSLFYNYSGFGYEKHFRGIKFELTFINRELTNYETPIFFELKQNYPNPFNSHTSISYSISNIDDTKIKRRVTLKIYDSIGREIKELVDGFQTPGNYNLDFNAINLASGVYYYSINIDNFIKTKKMLLLK